MNEQERRKRNRKVGIILCLLFIGLFSITTLALVVGFEAPPSVKKVVSVVTTVIAGIIGCCLIGAALIEVIVKIVKSRIRG
jgi:hypothetical protein